MYRRMPGSHILLIKAVFLTEFYIPIHRLISLGLTLEGIKLHKRHCSKATEFGNTYYSLL